jgi:hypothetical protein
MPLPHTSGERDEIENHYLIELLGDGTSAGTPLSSGTCQRMLFR